VGSIARGMKTIPSVTLTINFNYIKIMDLHNNTICHDVYATFQIAVALTLIWDDLGISINQ
jgi:uncharacterized membrane protein YgaE (UPF0421/DUF939 family)